MRFLLIAFGSIFALCLCFYIFTPIPFKTILYSGWKGFGTLAFIYGIASLCSQLYDVAHRYCDDDDCDKDDKDKK